MDLSLPVWVGDVGPTVGTLIVIGLSLWRGWVIPGRTVDRLIEAREQVVAVQRERADEWRATAEMLRARAETVERQLGTLLPAVETHTALLRSIQEAAARRLP